MAQELGEGSNFNEANGRASCFFLLHANHLVQGLVSSIDSYIHLSHLILQDKDSERQVKICKDSCSSCYCCSF